MIHMSKNRHSLKIEWSVGSLFVSSVVGASGPGKCVACRTFQSYRTGVEDNPYLVEREC